MEQEWITKDSVKRLLNIINSLIKQTIIRYDR